MTSEVGAILGYLLIGLGTAVACELASPLAEEERGLLVGAMLVWPLVWGFALCWWVLKFLKWLPTCIAQKIREGEG